MAAIYTTAGLAAIAAAIAKGTPLPIASVAVFSQQNPLDPASTELPGEVWRGSLSTIKQNGIAVTLAATIPTTAGGWWVYQFALFTADGTLLAIGDLPPAFKPDPGDPASSTYSLTINLAPVNGSQPNYILPEVDDNQTPLTHATLAAKGIRIGTNGLELKNQQGNWVLISLDETTLNQEEVAQ